MDGTLADLVFGLRARLRTVCSAPNWPSTSGPRRKRAKPSSTTKKRRTVAATTGDNRRSSSAVDAAAARDIAIASGARSRPRRISGRRLKPLENGADRAALSADRRASTGKCFSSRSVPRRRARTVQWQTHKWLVEQGFSTPSVIPLSGGRGKCAAALQLDYLIDDTPQNCVDVLSDSSTRAILLVDRGRSARRKQRPAARHRHRAQHPRSARSARAGDGGARQPLTVRKTPKIGGLEIGRRIRAAQLSA